MILTLKNNARRLVGLLSSLIIFSVPVFTLSAQGSVVLSVSPTQFKMTADPGQTWSSTLRVVNGNPTDITVYVSGALFTNDGETGQPRFITPPAQSNTLVNWLTLPREPITIHAEQATQIPFTITLPTDAPPGGQYAAIFVGTQPPASPDGATSVQTSQVIASLIFLQVTGDIVERGLIREFSTNQQVFNRPEASFIFRFENQGTVHLQPQGDITILNMWGEERGLVPINQKTFLGDVLPGQVRRFTFDWESEWSLTDLGLYTAIATVGYGTDAKQFTTARTTFWVIPWKILLSVSVGLGLFFWLVSWAVRLYIRRMLALSGLSLTDRSQPVVASSTPSIMAPLEAGMLDLRQRLHESQVTATGHWSRTKVVSTFVYHYRVFFIIVTLLLVVLTITVWYFLHTASMTRLYEVRVTERDTPVSFSNGQAITGTNAIVPKVLPSITLYDPGLSTTILQSFVDRLEALGYTIVVESTDDSTPRSTSVILHSVGYQEDALALSEILGGMLVSQYEVTNDTPAGIQLRLGLDISETVE